MESDTHRSTMDSNVWFIKLGFHSFKELTRGRKQGESQLLDWSGAVFEALQENNRLLSRSVHALSWQTLLYLETKTKLSSWVRECQQVRREVRGGKRAISISPQVACCLKEISAEEALLKTPGRQNKLHLSGLSGRLFGFQPLDESILSCMKWKPVRFRLSEGTCEHILLKSVG